MNDEGEFIGVILKTLAKDFPAYRFIAYKKIKKK